MIVRNTSTLVLLGRAGATAAAVSAATGLTPTRVVEAGAVPTRGVARDYSVWHLEVQSQPDDESGFGSMRALLALITPVADMLRALQEQYEARLDGGGFSDSSQAGFVLDADIAAGLAALTLPVYGTAYAG